MLDSYVQSQKSKAKSSATGGVRKIATKVLVKYILVFSLVLSLPTFLGFFDFDFPMRFYIGMQVFAVIIGIIHLWQVGKRFDWKNQNSFLTRLGLSLNILVISMILQGVIAWFVPPIHAFWMIFPTSILFFLLPVLTISTFDFAVAIPPPIYKKWRYPENTILPDPDTIDFANSHIVTFELNKSVKDNNSTFMKFKAPQDRLTFGDLFYFYMSEYNERNRESPIHYMNDVQFPYDWQFYIKPKKWWQSKIYIDPYLTVRENKIKENDLIVSVRV